jgi:hypothetical protein
LRFDAGWLVLQAVQPGSPGWSQAGGPTFREPIPKAPPRAAPESRFPSFHDHSIADLRIALTKIKHTLE